LVILTEEGIDNLFVVARKGEWQEILDFMQRHHFDCEIIAPGDIEPGIRRPANASDVV